MINNSFEELKTSGQLPSPSGVGMRILRLTQGDDFSTEEIGQAISADSALTGRLLKIANAAESGAVEPISTIGEATVRLGIRTVRNVALGLSFVTTSRTGACGLFNYDYYWARSLARAVAAQKLSRVFGCGVPEEMYVLGLLCDVGALALASVHSEGYLEVLELPENTSIEEIQAKEIELFQIDHCDVAGCMLMDWGLSEDFATAARSFEASEILDGKGGDLTLADLMQAADLVARLIVAGDETGYDAWKGMASGYVNLQMISGQSPEDFDDICVAMQTEWLEWSPILGLPVRESVDFANLDELVTRASERESSRVKPGTAKAQAPPELNLMEHEGSLRILAVDDDAMSLKLLERHLQKAGHIVTTAKDGDEALRIALQECPQLVVADWNMPGLDGVQLCQALRRVAYGQKIYFLLLTGVEGEDGILEAFDAGVDDYVVKPFNPRILLARIHAGRRIIDLQAEVEVERRKQEKYMMNLQVLTRKLRSAALTDPLTELPNRRYAMRRMGQSWESSSRTGKAMSVIMIDIDHFKKVNDVFGHDAGDVVLKETARILNEICREEEDVCRIGGEEFIVICANASIEEAAAAAERLRIAVSRETITWQDHEHRITLSFGVAGRTPEMANFEDLMKAADEAVYSAKHQGRNRVIVAGEEPGELRESA